MMDELIDFGPVKQWIAAQEEYQTVLKRRAPLTEAQFLALAQLSLHYPDALNQQRAAVHSPPPPPPRQLPERKHRRQQPEQQPEQHHKPEPAPDREPVSEQPVGEKPLEQDPMTGAPDWISILNTFRSKNRGPAPVFEDKSRMDMTNNAKMWAVFVTISEAKGLQFPCTGFGQDNDQGVTWFTQKKAAKQHAAYQAMLWLRDQGLAKDIEPHVARLKAITQRNSQRQGALSPPAAGAASEATTATILQQSQAPKAAAAKSPSPPGLLQGGASKRTKSNGTAASEPGGDDDDDDDEENPVQRVQELCTRLGFVSPKYVTTPVEDKNNIFSGYADFRDDDGQVPSDVGVVYNIYGQKNAKKKMAEQILVFLRDVEAKKSRDAENFRASKKQKTTLEA